MDPLHPDHGLVFRSFIHIFDEIKRRSDDTTHVIRASYLEIYNEKVNSLAMTNGGEIDIFRNVIGSFVLRLSTC